MCTSPLFRYGTFNDSDISFFKSRGFAYKNGGFIFGKDGRDYLIEVGVPSCSIDEIPCGQCLECRLKRSRDWGVRCMLEQLDHKESSFLTLTYDDSNLPFAVYTNEYGDLDNAVFVPTLEKKDLQDFNKRLRRYLEYHFDKTFRFFACGEYGEKNHRPHFHQILFGHAFNDIVPYEKDTRPKRMRLQHPLYQSQTLSDIWGKGIAVIGDVTLDSTSYTARYCLKKVNGKKKFERDEHLKRLTPESAAILNELNVRLCQKDSETFEDEFILHSNKPGIARKYFDDNKENIYENDKIVLDSFSKLNVVKPCRYFDKLFDLEFPSEFDKVRENRKNLALAQRNLELKRTNLTKYELNKARALALEAKTSKFVRSL